MTAAEVLATRRRHQSFWVPAVELEFGSYLVRKIAKGRLDEAQGRRLSALYRQAPDRCRLQVGRFWAGAAAGQIVSAAQSGDWSGVGRDLPRLREELLRRRALGQPLRLCRNWLSGTLARVRRWLRPEHGLSIVLLGPDGTGKSLARQGHRPDLGTSLLPDEPSQLPPALCDLEPAGTCTAPHEVRPRSCLASAIRAILYWFVYYGPGYLVTIRPALARFTLVVFDRHLVDALVDPKRYRYTGPSWLLRLDLEARPQARPGHSPRRPGRGDPGAEARGPAGGDDAAASSVPVAGGGDAQWPDRRCGAAHRGGHRRGRSAHPSVPGDACCAAVPRPGSGRMTAMGPGPHDASLILVLQGLPTPPDVDSLEIEPLGSGVQADLFVVRARDRSPVWRAHAELVVKLYKTERLPPSTRWFATSSSPWAD